jgi:hypothetical protein
MCQISRNFENLANVAVSKYLGTVTNQNYIPKKIKDKISSGTAFYNADRSLCLAVCYVRV